MKILPRYIIHEFVKPFIAASAVFLFLFMLSESFRIINIPNKTQHALALLPLYLLYQTPAWMMQILPFALLLAFMFSYNTLVKHNEVTAVKAGGININVLFKPIIILSFLVSIGAILAHEVLIPFTNKKSDYVYRVQMLGNTAQEKIEYTNIVYIGEAGKKILIRSFNALTNTAQTITVDQFDTAMHLTEQMYANTAVWDVAKKQWIAEHGVTRTFDPPTGNIVFEHVFKTEPLAIHETPDDFKTQDKDIDLMTIRELNKHITRLKRNSIPAFKELSQLHLQFAFPFANMIVVLIGIAFASSNVKSSKMISFGVSLVVSFVYWGLTSVGIALGENRVLPPFAAAWLPNILFLAGSLYFIAKQKR